MDKEHKKKTIEIEARYKKDGTISDIYHYKNKLSYNDTGPSVIYWYKNGLKNYERYYTGGLFQQGKERFWESNGIKICATNVVFYTSRTIRPQGTQTD